jgi:hypothetical protein
MWAPPLILSTRSITQPLCIDAAAYGARPALRVLLNSGGCDFLVRDWEGRLPSEIAREYGRDREMARRLLVEEMRQARRQGIDPGSLYKISARNPGP